MNRNPSTHKGDAVIFLNKYNFPVHAATGADTAPRMIDNHSSFQGNSPSTDHLTRHILLRFIFPLIIIILSVNAICLL